MPKSKYGIQDNGSDVTLLVAMRESLVLIIGRTNEYDEPFYD